MKHLCLDLESRTCLAGKLLTTLENFTPGSTALLRGSLANGTADAYSDIDILWEIPDDLFTDSVANISSTLEKVHAIASIRFSPEFQRSEKRRLVFIQYEGMPLFWRVDLDIYAQSINRDPAYDVDNSSAAGDDWSLSQSALMNAIAAIKSLLRGQEGAARGLLERGFERVKIVPMRKNLPSQIQELCTRIITLDPGQKDLALQILALHTSVFP